MTQGCRATLRCFARELQRRLELLLLCQHIGQQESCVHEIEMRRVGQLQDFGDGAAELVSRSGELA